MKAIKIRATSFFVFSSPARAFLFPFFPPPFFFSSPPLLFARPPKFFPFYSLPELATPIRLARARPATSLRFPSFSSFFFFSPRARATSSEFFLLTYTLPPPTPNATDYRCAPTRCRYRRRRRHLAGDAANHRYSMIIVILRFAPHDLA